MFSSALALAALLAAAPGDLYRCTDASGTVSYQDKPCPAGSATRFKGRTDAGNRELREMRQWLEQFRVRQRPVAGGAHAPRSAQRAPGTIRSPDMQSLSPAAERRLAACSERFLACADGDAARMDACVARVTRCAASGTACCPAECIMRYQRLRQRGSAVAAAVQGALLDHRLPSCADTPPR
jgi:hypothetical protein